MNHKEQKVNLGHALHSHLSRKLNWAEVLEIMYK
jgi:hypothetical protein